eukprot:116518-Chlamydomonas_euryale.AAC.1
MHVMTAGPLWAATSGSITPHGCCSICMRGPKCLPLCEPEARWSVHKKIVEAAGRGLSCLPRPRPALTSRAGNMHAHKCPRPEA